MSRRFLRPMIVGTILLLLLIVTALPTFAASRQQSGGHPLSPVAFATAPRASHVVPNPSLVVGDKKSSHYLYVEDGGSPDSIDVYKIGKSGLTHVGNYPTNANNYSEVYIGTEKLAISKKDKTHGNCLLLVDANNFSSPGFIDSFSIKANGALSAEVSHVQVAGGGDPSEVHVAKDTAYVDSPGTDFESYSVGAGCTLTFLSKASQSGTNIDFALVGSTELVAPDYSTGTIDTYTLGAGGAITFLKSTTSQISSPDGVAVQNAKTKSGRVTNVFTGMIGTPATTQGGQLNKKSGVISFLTGSPANDPNGNYGIPETFDGPDSLLIQGGYLSDSLGVYSVKAGLSGKPGSISFLQHAALPNGDAPMGFVKFNTNLFVDILSSGNLDACTVSKTGVSGCAAVVRLTTTTPFSAGIALL
jgi:hypothetical protein